MASSGRGGRATPKLTPDQLMQRVQRNVPDPYGELLQQTDSLLLTGDQVKRLQAARTDVSRTDRLALGGPRQVPGRSSERV